MPAVLSLDQGAGPVHLLGGPALMRRPALHRTIRPAAQSAWAHPYPTGLFSPVFYNSGDPEPAPADDPDPAADPADPPKPRPPAPSTNRPGLADGELVVTREWLEQKFSVEKDSGRRNGNQRLATDLGFEDVKAMRAYVEAQRKAEQAQLTEAERRAQQVEEDRKKIDLELTTLAAERRTVRLEQSLARLGAIDTEETPNLQDAMALLERELRADPEADVATVSATAERIKARRPELFGVRTAADPAAGQLPPAPGGAPAGGPPARQAPTGKPGDRGREMARLRGHKPAA